MLRNPAGGLREHAVSAGPVLRYNSAMLKRIVGTLGLLALALILGVWSRAYGALDQSLEALRTASGQAAPPPHGIRQAENRTKPNISEPAPPSGFTVSSVHEVSAPAEPPMASSVSSAAVVKSGAVAESTAMPRSSSPATIASSHPNSPDPIAPARPGETPTGTSITIIGTASAPSGIGPGAGPLIKLQATNGAERLGVVIDRGLALGPLMEVAYGSGAQRMESLATEPVALFSVKAGKAVPVVNAVGEKPGTPVKICGVNEEGILCVPAKLRQGLFYDAASDHVLLEAGSFAAEFPGGAALFKTGPAGGLMGYQASFVGNGAARFYPVNYFGRFSSLRTALGPLLSVAFSDLIMQGRYATEAAASSAPASQPRAVVSAPGGN